MIMYITSRKYILRYSVCVYVYISLPFSRIISCKNPMPKHPKKRPRKEVLEAEPVVRTKDPATATRR